MDAFMCKGLEVVKKKKMPRNQKTCEYHACNTRPSFNIPGGKSRFCRTHKTADMIDVTHKPCDHEGCNTRGSFGIKGGNESFCKKHRKDGMVSLYDEKRVCNFNGCKIRPSFGIHFNEPISCGKHKTSDMINVVSSRCQHDGCNIQGPNFDLPGGNGRFCITHKTDEMVDVRSKKCEHDGCKIQGPNFDIIGGKGRFCITHKTDDMVDVKSILCENEECTSRASFGLPNSKRRFCAKHKLEGMINVVSSRCQHEGCLILGPAFGFSGEKGQFCVTHKIDGMINVRSKLCEHKGCQTSASYGNPGNSKTHCYPHRKKGMIRHSNARCESCKNPAIWGINWIPKRCEKHKISDDQNLVEQQCVSCGLLYVLDKENKCENCNPISFLVTRLAKQNALMSYLDFNDLKGESTDKVVENGACGKERPDRVYDFGDKIVVLECDEHQHQDRQCLCEQTRMINIGQSFGGIPVYFIRWNPDDYSPEDDKKDPEEITKRHKLVGDLIRDIKLGRHLLPKGLVSVFYMYYDGWSSMSNESWEVITKME